MERLFEEFSKFPDNFPSSKYLFSLIFAACSVPPPDSSSVLHKFVSFPALPLWCSPPFQQLFVRWSLRDQPHTSQYLTDWQSPLFPGPAVATPYGMRRTATNDCRRHNFNGGSNLAANLASAPMDAEGPFTFQSVRYSILRFCLDCLFPDSLWLCSTPPTSKNIATTRRGYDRTCQPCHHLRCNCSRHNLIIFNPPTTKEQHADATLRCSTLLIKWLNFHCRKQPPRNPMQPRRHRVLFLLQRFPCPSFYIELGRLFPKYERTDDGEEEGSAY